MAAHYRDDLLHGKDHEDTHSSATRWRHEESGSFAKHASPREGHAKQGGVNDLTEFLNKSRIEGNGSAAANGSKPIVHSGNVQPAGLETVRKEAQSGNGAIAREGDAGGAVVKCGPLLNYRRMENETWFGSVLIVTETGTGEGHVPVLKLRMLEGKRVNEAQRLPEPNADGHAQGSYGVVNGVDYSSFGEPAPAAGANGVNGAHTNGTTGKEDIRVQGTKLYSDPANTFWRFQLEVPMQQEEIECEYTIPGLHFSGKKTDKQNFFIPAISESMRIMFHSCNGFSVGTDEAAYSGACLWNDVIRQHKETPFHVMLGGGDQIYNDGVRVNGPLRAWTDIGIPHKRKEYPFPEQLRRDCDDYYVKNYIRWYSVEPFASANGKIPQVNLWDDHDIIDGFGSYTDEFMKCAVFRGIGGVAHKYYLLFQHHIAPPLSTYTTDAPQTTSHDGVGVDARQLENTYVLENDVPDPSYIIGEKPGPYVAERSRSIYARLGARIAFFGIDARTERTRHQVNYPATYKKIFDRLRAELEAAKNSSSPFQHLIVLLGIPIAYPRLTWLENIFASPLMGPLKFMNKRFGFGGGFFNHFDGNVDLLDDLGDHYTAHTHKKERLELVRSLQALAAEYSVRVSILGGDVHLAAVGRFYSKPSLKIPISQDHRYMANIISSAIVNKPPPQAVANLLARRNKIHHLDHDTDETLLKFFDQDPGSESKTAKSNHVTMPSRNWAMISENSPNSHVANGEVHNKYDLAEKDIPKDGHFPIHQGEKESGTHHKAADYDRHGRDTDGSLDVCIRVEIDQHDADGKTQGYGMTIPTLTYVKGASTGRGASRGSNSGRA